METLTNTLEAINKGKWQWQSNTNPWSKTEPPQWESYSLDHNYLIEKAYYDQQKEVDLGDYLVYPLDLLQRKKGNLQAQRPIRRINWMDDEETHHRSQRYFESELPKTINRIFGGLGDFISFFSRRNKEMLEFTSHFKELERSNDLHILNHKTTPKLVECLEEVLLRPSQQKLNNSSLTQFQKKMLAKEKEKLEELISAFKKTFSSFEEFYAQILRAYTMNTDLYPDLNKYLRNEIWMEVDKLLPYAFCLCKAFFNLNLRKESPGRQDPSEEPTSTILYRGTAFDEFALGFYDTRKLQYFSWNALTSTTTNEKLAEEFMYNSVEPKKKKDPVMFIIEVPDAIESEEYLKWLDIRKYSAIPKEDEVILPPGSVFELVEVFTDADKKTTIKIKLKNEVKSLAHKGLMMQGTLQSQMTTEKEAKIMCLDGEELSSFNEFSWESVIRRSGILLMSL